MHAYGRRYQSGNSSNKAPKLGLIYPANPDFDANLLQMRYGNDLYLNIFSFDLSNPDPEQELEKIISSYRLLEN